MARSTGKHSPFPDGSVWVRAEPIGFSFDHKTKRHRHPWHQLTFALRGYLEVQSDGARTLVPPEHAIWVPAEVAHSENMRAPVTVRNVYVAPGALCVTACPAPLTTLVVEPLLRELIVHVCGFGALDRNRARQAHLIDVLVDLIEAAPTASLRLPLPQDPRAKRMAELIQACPDDPTSLDVLARRAGGSLRTIERRFRSETGLRVGEWRRRYRLLFALQLLESGATVTSAALEAGYTNPSAFTTAFTRTFGTPPTRRDVFARAGLGMSEL